MYFKRWRKCPNTSTTIFEPFLYHRILASVAIS